MKFTFKQTYNGSCKKSYFLVVEPPKGGRVKAGPLKKITFCEARKKSEKNVTTKLEGEGGLGP